MINSLRRNPTPANSNALPPVNPPGASGALPVKPPFSHMNLVGSFKRHWLISLLVFLAFLGCGGFVLWKKDKPAYEAHSIVYVSPTFPKILANDNEVELPYDSYFADQIQKPTRYDIIGDSIEKLPLAVRHRSGPALPYEIQVLQNTLDVKRIGSTYEMSIELTGPSPNGLAEIVNAVTDTYVQKAKNEEFYGLDDRLATLHQEQDRLQKQMDDRLAEQADLMRQLGLATISSGEGAANPFDTTSQTVRGQLAVARVDREAAEARYAAMLKGDGAGDSASLDAAADEAMATDSGLSATRSNLNNRRATLVEEMNGMRPDNPIYKKDSEEIGSIDGQIGDLRRNAGQHLQQKLRQDVARTRMVELQLIRELGEKMHAATTAAPKFQRAAELGPEIDSLQKAYDAIDDRIRELELESNSPGSIHVSTQALTPLGPKPSKLRLFLFALVFASLACAIGVPVVIDLLDGRIYTPQDIENVVGFHPLGVLVDEDEFRQEISGEYYFRLAAGVDYAVRNSGVRTFLFTSPAHGSGTTAVVRKLNEELRGFNLRTRTITASGTDKLEISREDVLLCSDHLLESRNRTDEIQSSPLTPLVAFFDYQGKPKGREGTAASTVVQTLHQAGDLCDVVLIDASPLPISAHTEYLARLVDATVLVVKSGMTTKQELERAARLLERLEVAGVAVILNKISLDRADRALKREFRGYEQSLRKRPSAAASATAEGSNTQV
jgi:succinoglycan biosynthesis transport protein ExoP